jgi:hypothetical protein
MVSPRRPTTVEKGSASDLSRKGKVGLFKEGVGKDDEFAQEDGEGELFGFAGGDQAEVKRPKDGVVAGSDECEKGVSPCIYAKRNDVQSQRWTTAARQTCP